MLMMIRHDLINHHDGQLSKSTISKIKADFNSESYELLSEEELKQVQ